MQPKWYVIQVQGGREHVMAKLISAMAPQDLVQECFAPSFTADVKVRGVWYPANKVMSPDTS